MLKLPEKISFLRPSQYLHFSFADAWLEDNQYGTWEEIVKRTSLPLRKGDMVLTFSKITRDDIYINRESRYQQWNNNRGRGEANRTYDAAIPPKSILPINEIDVTEHYEISFDRYACLVEHKPMDNIPGGSWLSSTRTDRKIGTVTKTLTIHNHQFGDVSTRGLSPEDILKLYKEKFYRPDHNEVTVTPDMETAYHDIPIGIQKGKTTYDYFLSATKRHSQMLGFHATANLQVYPDEFLNLTYLNTVWIQYVLQTGHIGVWCVAGAALSFAGAIPYLQKAMEFLREREKEEEKLLGKYMELYPGWQVDLSEWRMEHSYHRLTDARAKKFAKGKKSY